MEWLHFIIACSIGIIIYAISNIILKKRGATNRELNYFHDGFLTACIVYMIILIFAIFVS